MWCWRRRRSESCRLARSRCVLRLQPHSGLACPAARSAARRSICGPLSWAPASSGRIVVVQAAVKARRDGWRAEPCRRQRPGPVQVSPAVREFVRSHQFERAIDEIGLQPLQRLRRDQVLAQRQHQLAAPFDEAQRQRHGIGAGLWLHHHVQRQPVGTGLADDRPGAPQPAGLGLGQPAGDANPRRRAARRRPLRQVARELAAP